MGFEIIIPLVCLFFALMIAGLAIGSHFLKQGYRRKEHDQKRVNSIRVGWILTGITSLLLTAAIIYFIIRDGYSISLVLIIFSPLLALVIFVISLSIGASSLMEGYSDLKKKTETNKGNGKRKLVMGWISLGITIVVIIAVIISFILVLNYFSNIEIGAM